MPKFVQRTPVETSTPVHADPLLDRLYRARGVLTPEDIQYSLGALEPPSKMKGAQEAGKLLGEAIRNQERVLIISDYDCDGATGCAIAVEGLQRLGATDVCYVIPDRFEYGYGLSPGIVHLAAEQSPDIIVTVDNGIASVEGAKAVRDIPKPTRLIITDHHLAPPEIPEADAIVNPNQPGCSFPSKAMAGCGVMFYTLLATRKYLKDVGFYSQGVPDLRPLLDLVALGTVADVVPLDRNNRILVDAGLRYINGGFARPGIRALLEVSKREIGNIVASDFGFGAGPRLNAAGRLQDMTLGVRCLLVQTHEEARRMAEELDAINQERKEIEAQMKEEALDSIATLFDRDPDQYGLCFYEPSWHQGVVGIVASRIKDRYFRPVICFSKDKPGLLKGSGRSVEGFHLRDALANIHAQHPDFIVKFGGHAMAAGLTIREEHYLDFMQAFDREARAALTPEDIEGSIETDGELLRSELTLEVAENLKVSGPYGQKFPEPLFEGVFDIIDVRSIGKDGKHLKFILQTADSQATLEAIAFHCTEQGLLPTYRRLRAAYKLDVNEWNGTRRLQLMLDYFEEAA